MYENVNEIEKKYKISDFPLNVSIEPGNGCNLNCIMCAHDKLTRPHGVMSTTLYKKIIDEIAQENVFTRIWLDFYGEPLLIKFKLYYFIDYAKKQGIKSVCINTNGTLLNEEMADMLLDSGIDFISIDCDGFSKEVFEKIRVNANRDIVYNNIENLILKKKKYEDQGRRTPIIEIKINEMKENAQEVDLVMKYWKEKGLWTAKRRLISWAGKVNAYTILNHDRVACGCGIGILTITWDGIATNCAMDEDAKFPCGDVNKESIKSIWKRRNKTLIEKHMNHDWDNLPTICKNCYDWMIVGEERFDEKGNPIVKSYDADKKMI